MKLFRKIFAEPADDGQTRKCISRMLICCVVSLVLCLACLLSTTYSWINVSKHGGGTISLSPQWHDSINTTATVSQEESQPEESQPEQIQEETVTETTSPEIPDNLD